MSSKTILVVGASSGIGFALAQRLLDEGCSVVAASRSAERLAELPDAEHVELDVLEKDFPEHVVPEQLDGLVYCPGTINLRPFGNLKDEAFLEDYRINVLGAVRTIRAALPSLKRSESASVVLFSSVAAGVGLPFHASIAASKGAVEALVRSLAAEFAPKIRFNAVAPSLTDSPLASRLLSTDKKREESAARHPLKRVGDCEDQANAARFLLSDDSSWMTGQILHVDGGLSAIQTKEQ
ncbi:MAG: SDR family NAD(P)-dependent oxidoreductase [Verrucomicrobiota bacterium]